MAGKKTKIKLFLFDFTGVVCSGGHWLLCKKLGRRFRRDPKKLFDIIYTKYFNQLAVKKVTERESYVKALEELNLNLDWKEVRDAYLYRHKLQKQVVVLANRLRKQGYIVVLLSKNHRPYFEWEKKEFKLVKYFDALINTQDLNLPKMSPKTLDYILKRFKVRPEEIIYIDDQKPNLIPARRRGVNTILYTTFPKVQKKILAYLA